MISHTNFLSIVAAAMGIAVSMFVFQNPRIDQLGAQEAKPKSAESFEENQPFQKFTYTQLQMAMPMRITVWADSESHAQAACKKAFARAAELVKVFSDYDSNSEINRLMRSEIGQPQQVSGELVEVLEFSKRLHQQSEAAFDPTAGHVIRLWRKARKSGKLPANLEIETALTKSGFEKILIDPKSNQVTVLSENSLFDFGGVAKGYIGDCVIESLNKNEIEMAYYEAGGDIVLGSAPPQTEGWTIDVGVEKSGEPKKMKLANCAISTSGDARQFVEFAGKRYSHVIDPRTGLGVTTGRTAFVVAPNGMQSDALATVGCILNETDFTSLLLDFKDTKGWHESNFGFTQNASINRPDSIKATTLINKLK